jgi:hypothetical protein
VDQGWTALRGSRKRNSKLEIELLDSMREKQLEWQHAPAEERDAARRRFMDALEAFNALVLYNKIPDQ